MTGILIAPPEASAAKGSAAWRRLVPSPPYQTAARSPVSTAAQSAGATAAPSRRKRPRKKTSGVVLGAPVEVETSPT